MAFAPNRNDDKTSKADIAKAALMLGIGVIGAKNGGLRAVADGVSAGIGSHQASQDRRRKQSLEDLLMERAQRREDELDRQRAATHDRLMRSGGYVGESENRPAVEGRTLDQIMQAVTSNPTFGGAKDVYDPSRYGTPVGGYKYDRLSEPARRTSAETRRAERLATVGQPSERPSYIRVQGADRQWYAVNRHDPEDIHLLEDPEGNAIKGPTPRSSTPRPTVETPQQTTSRRAAEGTMKALNESTRRMKDIERRMINPRSPSASDSTSGLVRDRDALRRRVDSLRAEHDRQLSSYTRSSGGRSASSLIPALTPDESAMSDADLWELKFQEHLKGGLSRAQAAQRATQYMQGRRR